MHMTTIDPATSSLMSGLLYAAAGLLLVIAALAYGIATASKEMPRFKGWIVAVVAFSIGCIGALCVMANHVKSVDA